MKKSFPFIFILVLLSLTIVSADSGHSNLTFEQRAGFQKAIEEVYWKHTIWPAENPGPKPELKTVMPDLAIRRATREYIRNSNALDSLSERRITPRRMQAEMNRMARETQNPELLRELWAALLNDPYVIAECFARPALVERFIRKDNSHLHSQEFRSDRITNSLAYNYKLPGIKGTQLDVSSGVTASAANTWTSTSTVNAPSARGYHTAGWTGTYMIVWGGRGSNVFYKDGKKYNPATNAWSAISSTGGPSARSNHTAVWTGTQMIVYGGL